MKTKHPNEAIWGKSLQKLPLSSFYVDHVVLSIGPDLKCGLYAWWDSNEEN